MKTLTVTKARQNLGGWLKQAADGADIGVIVGDKIIAFRLVEIFSGDYVEREYGLSADEADRAAKYILNETTSAETVEFKPGMFSNANRADKAVSGRRKKAPAR